MIPAPSVMLPCVAGCSPAKSCRSVVLPAPLRPKIKPSLLAGSCRLMLARRGAGDPARQEQSRQGTGDPAGAGTVKTRRWGLCKGRTRQASCQVAGHDMTVGAAVSTGLHEEGGLTG